MKIAVTGGSGKLGRAVVHRLEREGHAVLTLDSVGSRGDSFTRVDLTDYGQTVDALCSVDNRHSGLDAVVHLAAIPAGGLSPDSATFANNMLATFNVFQGSRRAGIKRIVYASSETLLGIPFDTPPPYLPVDEDYPSRPESMYAVVKHLEEELAQKFVRWDPELSITALRFSNVLDVADYRQVPGYQDDPTLRQWNLWGYIDTRDGAQAVQRALAANLPGFDTFIIAAADTLMSQPSASLAATAFPDVEFKHEVAGTDTLLSIAKARRVLGYEPEHSWRDSISL
ncbi:nucleoside-diphosphate-sugar epimerase [Glaciihabitans tibetensis]|uniref:Nucleoside-diphosphate-sugar epimerase n=1 Tax=Glaciihabitans tibetensis TaxID=1266600 RepID=A0A2T0V713_9MICO|nr:NAD(P)-dependent oxidoreductase [Glaciihabitans tibetensis]PRY65979.1 nucleoside-diphosphate-sugar epimerase [Glaciihabitans tibetensis]